MCDFNITAILHIVIVCYSVLLDLNRSLPPYTPYATLTTIIKSIYLVYIQVGIVDTGYL